jgi:hypothetical protein
MAGWYGRVFAPMLCGHGKNMPAQSSGHATYNQYANDSHIPRPAQGPAATHGLLRQSGKRSEAFFAFL